MKNKENEEFLITSGMDIIKRVEKEEPPKMIWGDIPEGSSGIIVGQAKTGKTTFGENLGFSLSVGRDSFFNKPLDGIPKKVLFVNFEESYRLRGLRNQKQIGNLSDKELELFSENYISTPTDFPEFLNTPEDWTIVRNYILKVDPDVIFMDSITRMCIGEIEKSSVSQKFFNLLNEHFLSLNKTFIFIHHTTKKNDVPLDMSSIGGSRVVSQEFEYAYGLSSYPNSKGKRYGAMLYNKYEFCDSDEAYVYEMDGTGWVNFINEDRTDRLFYGNKNKQKDGRKDETNKIKILKCIESLTSPDSPTISSTKLLESLVDENREMSKSTLYGQLKSLLNKEEIVKEDKGEYKLKITKNETE